MIPIGAGLYAVSRAEPDAPSILTRLINRYTEATERFAERNALHVSMIERAGDDRALFNNAKAQEHVNMRFPEYVELLFAERGRAVIRRHASIN